eukprot:m51a1_g8378 putative d-isomer specific 2-hydroxyacid dehydrogenase (332) ;mRNA; r:168028-169468
MAAKTVLIYARAGDETADVLLARLQRSGAPVHAVLGHSPADLAPSFATADALIAWDVSRSAVEQIVDGAPGIRWVHSKFAGLDWLLYPAAPQALVTRPVVVTTTRTVYSWSLAEWALAGALYFEKQVARLQRQQAARAWDKFVVGELRGKTLCVVGYGDIGRCVATLARAFGMHVLAVRRSAGASAGPAGPAAQVAGPESLEAFLSQADYVALALPLTPQTRGLVGARQLAAMRRSAVLINVGRGATVDEAALVEALREGRIAGAALDVAAVEPLPESSELWSLPNVLISPHCADNTPAWTEDAYLVAEENCRRFCRGEQLQFVAEATAGY